MNCSKCFFLPFDQRCLLARIKLNVQFIVVCFHRPFTVIEFTKLNTSPSLNSSMQLNMLSLARRFHLLPGLNKLQALTAILTNRKRTKENYELFVYFILVLSEKILDSLKMLNLPFGVDLT